MEQERVDSVGVGRGFDESGTMDALSDSGCLSMNSVFDVPMC
jgi:hypothetical protein